MPNISEVGGMTNEIQNDVDTLLSQFDLKNEMIGGSKLLESVSPKTIALVNQTFMNKELFDKMIETLKKITKDLCNIGRNDIDIEIEDIKREIADTQKHIMSKKIEDAESNNNYNEKIHILNERVTELQAIKESTTFKEKISDIGLSSIKTSIDGIIYLLKFIQDLYIAFGGIQGIQSIEKQGQEIKSLLWKEENEETQGGSLIGGGPVSDILFNLINSKVNIELRDFFRFKIEKKIDSYNNLIIYTFPDPVFIKADDPSENNEGEILNSPGFRPDLNNIFKQIKIFRIIEKEQNDKIKPFKPINVIIKIKKKYINKKKIDTFLKNKCIFLKYLTDHTYEEFDTLQNLEE